jgi:bacterioferritin-associated ferredoxin
VIVCICHRVSDRDIGRAVQEGCSTFEALQDELCVGTACGACQDCAHDTFHDKLRQNQPATIAPLQAAMPSSTLAVTPG